MIGMIKYEKVDYDEKIEDEDVFWNDSNLLTKKEEKEMINKWLNEVGIFFQPSTKKSLSLPKKLFQGSKNGFTINSFYSKCNHKGKTVVIVRTTNGRTFGGFTNVAWDSGYKGFRVDPEKKSFLFSLDEKQKYPILVPQKAIYCRSLYGITFGGGHDLFISNKCNLNSKSYTNSPVSYSTPSNTTLAGTKNFQVLEIEVWKVGEREKFQKYSEKIIKAQSKN